MTEKGLIMIKIVKIAAFLLGVAVLVCGGFGMSSSRRKSR